MTPIGGFIELINAVVSLLTLPCFPCNICMSLNSLAITLLGTLGAGFNCWANFFGMNQAVAECNTSLIDCCNYNALVQECFTTISAWLG